MISLISQIFWPCADSSFGDLGTEAHPATFQPKPGEALDILLFLVILMCSIDSMYWPACSNSPNAPTICHKASAAGRQPHLPVQKNLVEAFVEPA